ncbi:MAG TPA: DNA polymerase III subunit delta [Chloroflexota bacterium]|nr:DNA polymerase III subunit delta [Chloroflexota bacterium]
MLALYHGGDAALCDEQIARVIAAARAADASVEVTRIDGETVRIQTLQGALASFSLFSAARLVIIDGLAARFQKEEGLREPLTAALSAVPDGLDVLFREARDLGATHPLAHAVRAAGGAVTACGQLTRREFPGKLLAVASELGVAITPHAAELLADRCFVEIEVEGRKRFGPDLTKGRTELHKLATYVGAGHTIDERVVAALVDEPFQQIFAFTDALAARQLARANALLEQLLARGEVPQIVFANVVRHFRLLLLCAAGQQERGETDFLRRGEFHLRDFQLRNLERQVGAFPLPRLRQTFGLLLRADEAIKTGRLDAADALRLVCASICTGADLLPVVA